MAELYANRRLRLKLSKFISNLIFSQILLTILILDISLRLLSAILAKRSLCDSRERDQKTRKKKFKKAHYCVEISDARASREAEWPIASRPHFIGPQAFAATSSFSKAPQRGGAFEKRSLVRRGVPSFPRCESRSQQFRAWQ